MKPRLRLFLRLAALILTTAAIVSLYESLWFGATTTLRPVRQMLESSIMVDSQDRYLLAVDSPDWTRLVATSHFMRESVVGLEDHRFNRRLTGIDLRSFPRAIWQTLFGNPSGASTLQMQIARNIFDGHFIEDVTMPGVKEDGVTGVAKRKFAELILALRLDQEFSKPELLEVYLNGIYFGKKRGIGPASAEYFNKKPKELTKAECLFFCAILQNPSLVNRPRAEWPAIAEMKLDTLKRREHVSLNLDLAPSFPRRASGEVRLSDRKLQTQVRQELNDIKDSYPGVKTALQEGGATIFSTLNVDWMRKCEKELVRFIAGSRPVQNLAGAICAIDPRNGGILAIADSRERGWEYLANYQRDAGSTIKILIALAALEAGYTCDSLVLDQPHRNAWPRNSYNRYLGAIRLRDAFARSSNAAFVNLLSDENVARHLDRLTLAAGLRTFQQPEQALGTDQLTLLKLSAVFASIQNGGAYVEPYLITRIDDRLGKQVYQARPARIQLVSPQTANAANSLLIAVRRHPQGTARRLRIADESAGAKTGTTGRDIRLQIIAPHLSLGIWAGLEKGSGLPRGYRGSAALMPIGGKLFQLCR